MPLLPEKTTLNGYSTDEITYLEVIEFLCKEPFNLKESQISSVEIWHDQIFNFWNWECRIKK